MNVEIIRVQNGWLVRPSMNYSHGHGYAKEHPCWVFNTYSDMTRRLEEILIMEEPK